MAFPDTSIGNQFSATGYVTNVDFHNRVDVPLDVLASRVIDTGWIVPTLSNSWVAFGGAPAAPQYRVKAGIVYVKGAMKSGTLSTVFTFAVGARPLDQIGGVLGSGATGGVTWAITAAGVLSLAGYIGAGSNAAVNLDGIRFIAEQ